MLKNEYTDIVPLLKNLCLTLAPIAGSRYIALSFTTEEEKIHFHFDLNELLSDFSRLISSILEYMPANNSLFVKADVIEKEATKYVSIKIHNTGINLKMVSALTKNSNLPVTLYSSSANETTFEICYCLAAAGKTETDKPDLANGALWNYISVVNGIKSHFSKLNDPVARLAETRPKEANFLTKINNCILKNLPNEQFDANALSTAMAMSRAQLLRRLKSLTGNSPGYYIKTMRLEKAKELLVTADVSISEAAFQTGFASPSNFTKVFSEKYGMSPSQFLRTRGHATNE